MSLTTFRGCSSGPSYIPGRVFPAARTSGLTRFRLRFDEGKQDFFLSPILNGHEPGAGAMPRVNLLKAEPLLYGEDRGRAAPSVALATWQRHLRSLPLEYQHATRKIVKSPAVLRLCVEAIF